MSARLISQRITGWCLRNWNFPLSDHTHVCQQSAHLPHRHRCRCGDELDRVAVGGETP